MKACIFDLDNTLYDELSYVRSGFKAASFYISERFGFSNDEIYKQMLSILELQGRGRVFDTLLRSYGIHSENLIKTLLFIYRNHVPSIVLPEEAANLLSYLKSKNVKLGLITDGDSTLQLRKIEALGVKKYFDHALHTHIFGEAFSKPNHLPFRVMLNLLDVSPSEACYVGDRYTKDIVPCLELGIEPIMFTNFFSDNCLSENVCQVDTFRKLTTRLEDIFNLKSCESF